MNVIDKIHDGIDCVKGILGLSSTYTGCTTISNCEITAGKISTECLDPGLLKRLDKMEKMINELYYPMKGGKND